MEALLRNKLLYLLTIIYISIFAIIFKFIYPEVRVTSLPVVISLLGFIFALGSKFVINRISKREGKNNGK
jgi:hypothetical protein